METRYKYIFGPVPSRRMGLSLGVSPIPRKTCNYSCIYCQIGRTDKMTNERKEYIELDEIISEFKDYLKDKINFDVITIVGEGEPTLYSKLGLLIQNIKELTLKPIAVITNGALLSDENVREQLKKADIVLPSFDAYDEESFKKINRPFGKIKFQDVYQGLKKFSREYKGQLWLEIMLIKGINDDKDSLVKLKKLLDDIRYDRLYINSPVRPPAEKWVEAPSRDTLEEAVKFLGGISIDVLSSHGFYSEIEDDYEAILSIIKRHPMNQYEIKSFLKSRECEDIEQIFKQLNSDDRIEIVKYKDYITYRIV